MIKAINLFLVFAVFLTFLSALSSSQGIVGVSPGSYLYEDVLRGGYSERSFVVSYSSEEEVDVSIEPLGETSLWFDLSSNHSKISKNSPFRFVAAVEPPSDTPNGNYTGILRVKTSQLPSKGSSGRVTGNVIAVLDIALTVEVTDIEIVRCRATNFVAHSAEKGDNLEFRANFANEGNIRLKPRFVVDLWDQEQTYIVKTEEFIAKDVLPTRQSELSFLMSTNDLDLGQYWVEMHSLDCLDSQLLTVDVLQPGALKAQGLFKEIIADPVTFLKETARITAVFENTGEKEVEAQFRGQIVLNDKIVQVLESEKTSVKIGEITNFSFFFTPTKTGNYIIDGRFFYDNKRTFQLSKLIQVLRSGSFIKSFMAVVLYVLIISATIYLYYRIRNEIKKYRGLR